MKLATLKEGGRDGTLLVVSRNLAWTGQALSAPTLQAALDDWAAIEPRLAAEFARMDAGAAPEAIPFDPTACASPLPRAYQWADGSAYVNHVELVRKARAPRCRELLDRPADVPGRLRRLPRPATPSSWRRGLGHRLRGRGRGGHRRRAHGRERGRRRPAHPPLHAGQRRFPAQPDPRRAGQGLRLLPGQAFFRFLPGRRHAGRVGRGLGRPEAPPAPDLDPERRALRPAQRRHRHDLRLPDPDRPRRQDPPASAGTIVGSGTVSNKDRSAGSSCLAEKRMLETIETGEAKTPFLSFGDRVRIEMFDGGGGSVFGAIEQEVRAYEG